MKALFLIFNVALIVTAVANVFGVAPRWAVAAAMGVVAYHAVRNITGGKE